MALLLLLSAASLAAGQSGSCLALTGSSACPGFSTQYISPSNLSNVYPFLSAVTDVTSFDSGLLNYLDSTFKSTKEQQFGCTNTSSAYALQYARTFVCGELVTRSYAAGCTQAPYEKMTCQATCLQFAVSENLFVSDPTACGATSATFATRQGNLTYDFTTCTDWTSLISNNTATCVLGQNNEPNCGFGSTANSETCNYCNPATKGGQLVDSCCIGSNTDLSSCGYVLNAAQVAASPTPSSVSPGASSTMSAMSEPTLPATTSAVSTSAAAGAGSNGAGADNSGSGGTAAGAGSPTGIESGSSGLSGGAIAGIVIGSIVGSLLLLALLLFFLARRRRSSQTQREQHRGLLGAAAGTSGFDDSEKAMLTKEALAAKEKKLGTDSDSAATPLPSPLSSGTLGMISRDSDDSRGVLGSGKSSPSITTVAAGTLAAYGAAAHARHDIDRDATPRPISQDTSGTGSSNERNLVASVRDQYSSADIVPGSEVVAIYAYEPNLPDELRLQPDTVVTVRKIYDDGWAIGSSTDSTGTLNEGAFPLVVCTVVGADSDNNSSGSSQMHTAAEGQSSGRPAAGRSGSSRRTSSIGDTSFESAPSHTPTDRGGGNTPGGGIFGSFFRRHSQRS